VNLDNLAMQLLQYISVAEGEITPEVEAELARRESNLMTEIDGLVGVIRQIEGFESDCKAEADRLWARAKSWQNKASYLRRRIVQAMQRIKTDKISTAKNTVSVCLNSTTPIVMVPGAAIPDAYVIVKQVESTDMDAIRTSLEAGDELSFARLGERGQHLRIK
jgi:hypothetical protein